MTDLDVRTSNVTLTDEVTGDSGSVNTDKEQLTHDQHAIDQLEIIAGSTGGIESKTATSWQYFAGLDKAFVATHSATLTGGSSEQDFMLLYNPNASGIYLRIKYVTFGIQTPSTPATFRLYKHPVISDVGTAITIENYRTNDVAGDALAYHTPTITDREHIFKAIDLNSAGVGAVATDEDLALYILEDTYLLLTIEQYANNKSFSLNLSWAEETIPTP